DIIACDGINRDFSNQLNNGNIICNLIASACIVVFIAAPRPAQSHFFRRRERRTWILQAQRISRFNNTYQTSKATAAVTARTTLQYGSSWVELSQWVVTCVKRSQDLGNRRIGRHSYCCRGG